MLNAYVFTILYHLGAYCQIGKKFVLSVIINKNNILTDEMKSNSFGGWWNLLLIYFQYYLSCFISFCSFRKLHFSNFWYMCNCVLCVCLRERKKIKNYFSFISFTFLSWLARVRIQKCTSYILLLVQCSKLKKNEEQTG